MGYSPWVAKSGTQLGDVTLFHTCRLLLCLFSSVLQKASFSSTASRLRAAFQADLSPFSNCAALVNAVLP